MISSFLPRCPTCHRPLRGHDLLDFQGNRLIVCKHCGARLRARISVLSAVVLGLLTVLMLAAAILIETLIMPFLFLVWGILAPLLQVRFTIVRRISSHTH